MSDLLAQSLEIAFGRLAPNEPMLPFVLAVDLDGHTTCTTIVTDRSDKAAFIGRRMVRGRAASTAAYAIVTDAYVRHDDQRLDAIFVERAGRGRDEAIITAYPYAQSSEGPRRVDGPIELGQRPTELEDWDPTTFHWGPITPDAYVEERKLAVHIVNHLLESPDNVARTVRFLRARARHHGPHLPAGTTQLVHIDDRGQTLTAATRSALRTLTDVAQVAFTSDRGA